jgi:hypothetical protein
MTQAMKKPETQTQLTLDNEDENILNAAKQETKFDRLMKFRDGRDTNKWYFIQDDVIPLGTKYLAHATAWTKVWIKFVDGKRVAHKPYRVALKELPPPREELDDCDEASWPKRDGKPNDPWVFQHLLPLENLETGEVVIFTTATVGGRIAVSELAEKYAEQKIAKRRANQHGGQPIIQLAWCEMPTKYGTKRPRPVFEIVGWDETEVSRASIPEETLTENTAADDDDMNDEIPF